jgi:Cof subfamily protein (haloacid dehalogenase superfamily)
MYRLVVSDMDGTLLDHQKQLSKRNLKAVDMLKKQGIPFVLATGRSDAMVKPYTKALKSVDIVIGCDGAVIRNIKTGETLFEKKLDVTVCKKAFEICRRYGLEYYVFTKDELVGDDENNTRLKIHSEFNRNLSKDQRIPVKFTRDLQTYVEEHAVYKIVASHEKKEYLDEVADILKNEVNADAIRSGKKVLAIKAKGVSKAAALQELAVKMGITMKEIVAFGDEVNDIEMLQTAGLGVAMENADEIVQQNADQITKSNDDDGVAVKIEEILKKQEGEKRCSNN